MTTDVLEQAVERLRKAGIESPRLEARLLLAHAMGVAQEDLVTGRNAPNAEQLAQFSALLARREAREPIAYILGKREFWSLDFAVGPGVLIPRPESETLVETALAEFPASNAPLRVLDLGTGSGCLLIAFLKERGHAHGIGVDILPEALAWAERNVRAHGMANRVKLICGAWAEDVDGVFDVILCNPPYVADTERALLAPEVARYEPSIALDAGKDGLDAYRQLAPQIRDRLRSHGRAYVEVGQGQATDVATIFEGSGLSVVRTVKDLAGVSRCLVATMPQ